MRKILIIVLGLTTTISFGQTNLVENPTFNMTNKKGPKEVGQIDYAAPWISPTLALADLYVPKSKNYAINVPDNDYGEEKPMEGKGYAGIVAYSYKEKVPRTYLQGKLTEKLEAGKEYCVTFHVSLADLSKYACNYIAAALTDKEMKANNSDMLQFDNTIVSKRKTIYEQQFYWIPVCGVYKAKGGEQYITIGNFTEEAKLGLKKVKRPRGFTKPQKYDAYYYIDNVSVVAKEEVDKCDCDVIPGMENAETVERDFSSDDVGQAKNVKIINTDGSTTDGKPTTATVDANAPLESIDGIALNFDPKSFAITEQANKVLDKIVEYLKKNTAVKIKVTGYYDKSESDVDKLDGRRVSSVYKYLISKGIVKERIARDLGGDTPADEEDNLKNMRVEIEENNE